MLLYTCPARTIGATTPVIQHPCGVAAKALRDAGHAFETEVVGGFKNVPLSRRGRRDRIEELSGQSDVPLLLLDDGEVVCGQDAIVRWAGQHPAAR